MSHLLRKIPLRWKRPFYNLAKSPVRKEVGRLRSLWLEASAWVCIGFRTWLLTMGLRKLQPVSVCTGIKDRTDNYLRLVDSLAHVAHKELIELSVFDCGSDDYPRLEKEIRQRWQGKLTIRSEGLPFSRAMAFNRAVGQATSPIVFAADADIVLPHDIVRQCNRMATDCSSWFPVLFYLFKKQPRPQDEGLWWYTSTGMFAAWKRHFLEVGGYDEKHKVWGYEDWDLYFRLWEKGIAGIRTRSRGMKHHWHPANNPKKAWYH